VGPSSVPQSPASRRQLLTTEGERKDYKEVPFGRYGQPRALVPESIRVGNSRVSRTAPRVSMLHQSGGGRIRLPPDYHLSTINSVKLARGGQLLYGKRTDGVALSGSYPQNGITAAGEGIVS
jgi:hypothetical protein